LDKKIDNNSAINSATSAYQDNNKNKAEFVINESNTTKKALCEVKCQQCGEKTKIAWMPGMPCPVCGSKSFLPIIKVDHIEREKNNVNVIKIEKIEKKVNYKQKIKKLASRKNIAILTITILALIWIKIGLFLLNDRLNKSVPPANLVWEYYCSKCDHEFYDKPQIPPLVCPLCGKKQANMVFYCLDCKTKFPLSDKEKTPRCPKCTSNKIIAYRPDINKK